MHDDLRARVRAAAGRACWSTGMVPATGPHRAGIPAVSWSPSTSFRRRISAGGCIAGVGLPAGQVRWLDAREHAGDTVTHTIFVELKDRGAASPGGRLGPVPS
jgi:hypothetical protein